MIHSRGTKSHMLERKLHSGTSKIMQLVRVHLDLPLFWKSHYATYVPACVILYYRVTRLCKGFISNTICVISSPSSSPSLSCNSLLGTEQENGNPS